VSRESTEVRDNAEITRRSYEAMNRGDFDAAAANIHPEVEWLNPPELAEVRIVKGIEAVKGIWRNYVEPFDEFKFETLEFIDRGELTFHALKLTGTGHTSGATVEMTWYQVAHLDGDGRVVRVENYLDPAQAREASKPVGSG
jgi:ketosteroid isomerase-like protein